MHVKRVRRNWYRSGSNIVYPHIDIDIFAIVDEVLQMICISAFATLAEKKHSLADKDTSLRLGLILVDKFMPLPQCFNLLGDDALAVLGRDGE